jgi:hypothetical protein
MVRNHFSWCVRLLQPDSEQWSLTARSVPFPLHTALGSRVLHLCFQAFRMVHLIGARLVTAFLIPEKLAISEGNLCMPSRLHGLSVGCVLHNEDSAGNHRGIFQILLNCKVSRAAVLQKVSTSDM